MKSEYTTELGSIKIELDEIIIDDLRKGSMPDKSIMRAVRDHLIENIGFEIERMMENHFLENERKVA